MILMVVSEWCSACIQTPRQALQKRLKLRGKSHHDGCRSERKCADARGPVSGSRGRDDAERQWASAKEEQGPESFTRSNCSRPSASCESHSGKGTRESASTCGSRRSDPRRHPGIVRRGQQVRRRKEGGFP